MPLPVYDSPTFLGSKDKILLGLSLPQMATVMGVLVGWLVISFMFPYSTVIRMIFTCVGTFGTAIVMFTRISGIGIPMYLFYLVKGLFVRPSFEEHRELMLGGNLVWLEQLEHKSKWSQFSFLRRQKAYLETDQGQSVKMELEAEVSKNVNDGAMAAGQAARDGVRAIFGGR